MYLKLRDSTFVACRTSILPMLCIMQGALCVGAGVLEETVRKEQASLGLSNCRARCATVNFGRIIPSLFGVFVVSLTVAAVLKSYSHNRPVRGSLQRRRIIFLLATQPRRTEEEFLVPREGGEAFAAAQSRQRFAGVTADMGHPLDGWEISLSPPLLFILVAVAVLFVVSSLMYAPNLEPACLPALRVPTAPLLFIPTTWSRRCLARLFACAC